MAVSPSTAVASAILADLTFTFTKPNGNGGRFDVAGAQLSLLIPAGWTQPQTSNSAANGFVALANNTCSASINSITGTGPWTILVNQACDANGQSFQIVYGSGVASSVIAPAAAATYTFTTKTKSTVALVNISSQPTVTVTADNTAPTVTFTNPIGATSQSSTSVNVTWTESDAGSGVNAASRSVQRQSGAPVGNACTTTTFANDGAATTAASPRLDSGLSNNTCYRWRVTLADNAGNSATTNSGTVLVDASAPTITFTNPVGATTQSSTSVNVTWTESDTGSGLNTSTRSIQRQSGAPVSGSCSATTFTNSGAATTAASPRNDTGLSTNICYRWLASISDNAGNSTASSPPAPSSSTTPPRP